MRFTKPIIFLLGLAFVASAVVPLMRFPAQAQQAKSFAENLNGVSLEMVSIPAGVFTMGSKGNDHSLPLHQVSVPAFYMGKYEITQAQWKAVTGEAESSAGDRTPVEAVRWQVAKQFCQRLKEMTGKAYRLPSEAEWEYACRAGTNGDFAGDVNKMAWYKKDLKNWENKSNARYAHSVGLLLPNAFGLYDMHGNVTEWCEDWWHDSYDGAPTDGSAWTEGGNSKFRVGRGGLWADSKGGISSSFRYLHPLDHFIGYGLRVALSAK